MATPPRFTRSRDRVQSDFQQTKKWKSEVLILYSTVDSHLSGLHLSGGLDYPDTKFSRDSQLHVSFLALMVYYNNRCTCVLSHQKMATPL